MGYLTIPANAWQGQKLALYPRQLSRKLPRRWCHRRAVMWRVSMHRPRARWDHIVWATYATPFWCSSDAVWSRISDESCIAGVICNSHRISKQRQAGFVRSGNATWCVNHADWLAEQSWLSGVKERLRMVMGHEDSVFTSYFTPASLTTLKWRVVEKFLK